MRSMRLVLVMFVALWAAACNVSPEQEARDLCTAVCNCTTASPAKAAECVEECTPEVPALPDDCIDCIYTYSQSCSDLDRCEPMCDQPQPQP